MNQKETLSLSSTYLIENYGRLPISMHRGENSYIWDADGRRYIDLFVGFGGGGTGGHCHPKISTAIKTQADILLSHGNLFTNELQTRLAEKIISKSFSGKAFFCHSGAEADEAAIKLVRKAAGPERYKIISFENCFHGRTMGGLSLTPRSFQEGFDPMLEGNAMVPFGDLSAVQNVIDAETAGIFVEPIQGEGGINVPTAEFMKGLRALCDSHGLLLICDEVWTAPAKTGKWFAYQHFGIVPDVITLAKSLGGGLPVAACIAAEKWADVLGPGSHGCTMGGNPLCTAAALASLELIEEENLVERAKTLESDIRDFFKSEAIPCVQEVRGKGVLLGVKLDDSVPVKPINAELYRSRSAGLHR